MSVSDLEKLSYLQVQAILDIRAFVNDAVEYAEDDEQASKGEAAFFG